MSEEIIVTDAEWEDAQVGTALEPVQHGTLFRTDEPTEILRRASATAEALAAVVRKQNLTSNIQGKEHVRVEGWTLLGSMLGVFPVTVWSRRTEHDEGWEARVEARTLSGAVVGAAEAECLRSEKQWSHNPTNKYGKAIDARDDYALRSMAQTRATSKALRQPLGFVMQLAGFDPTPAEEMPREAPPAQTNRVEGPAPIKPPTSWAKLTEMVSVWDEATHDTFNGFCTSARLLLFPDGKEAMSKQDRDFLFQKCAGAAVHLREQFDPNELPYPTVDEIRACFARVLDGQELALEGEA